MLPENRIETERLTKSSGASFAVAWDADADRCMFVDETGEFYFRCLHHSFARGHPLMKAGNDNAIIFDPRVIWPALKVCEQHGARAIISKGGHAFMKEACVKRTRSSPAR